MHHNFSNQKPYKSFHHIGFPTDKLRKNEVYNKEWNFYASGYFQSQFGIEWLRFENDTKIHPLIKKVPHIAFVVEDIKASIKGQKVIYEPNQPAQGVTVCFIEYYGMPIEFLEFQKPENEIWPNDKKLVGKTKNSSENEKYKYHHFTLNTSKNKMTCSVNEQMNSIFKIKANQFNSSDFYDKAYITFCVENMNEALRNQNVIIKPYRNSKGVLTAMIEENGALIELIQKNTI